MSSTRKPDRARTRESRAALVEENEALRKTVRALMDRVERAVDQQGTAFSWFHAAAKLEETVRLRTQEYESLNVRLKRELESRREIELALKQAKSQAELANQSKTRFLAAASHDLRQPLSSALLFLESLDDRAMKEADRALLRGARLALSSLSNLLNTLLDVARLDSGGIEPQLADFPVAALFERIGPEFEAVARSVGLELSLMPCRVWVRTDMHLLETVLRNFVSNALRYTPKGRVLVGCRRRKQGIMICVCDSGVGVEKKHLDAIFEPYYQVPSAGRRGNTGNTGIGLGLSIVSRIARLLSIECVVRSTPGRGSVFAVVVPYGTPLADQQPQLAWHPSTNASARPRSLTVVVMDDNPDVLRGMCAILEKWGHRAIAAPAATDALVQLIASDIEPDLVISDYHLANGTKGDEAIAEVQREFDRHPAALVMTSDPDPALHRRLQQSGLMVLAKPLNLTKLQAMLDRL